MKTCCIQDCNRKAVAKKEEFYKQHCVPKWIQNNMKDLDISMDRGGHLINYFTGKSVQSPLVYGEWCEFHEKEFTTHDNNGLQLFSRPLDWKNPGIMKGAGMLETPTKYKVFKGGQSFDIETEDGVISGKSSMLLIDNHIEPFNMGLSLDKSTDKQMKAKGFVLSVLERLQYHPDADRFPFFKQFKDMGLDLRFTQNFDVCVSRYFNSDPVWDQIKYSMDDPFWSPANSLEESKIRIIDLEESVKVEWNMCGFRFLIFPKIVENDHMWYRHPSWYLGRSKDFKMAMIKFDTSVMADKIMDHHEKEQEDLK